jgi:uncharacterized protein (TIGR02246 family)
METGYSAAFAAALGRRDASAAAALYADDGALLTPAADLIRGRTDIEAFWREGIAFGLSGIELEATDVTVIGAVAIEIGRYALRLDGATDRGKYLVLHRRDGDGAWRRAVEVYNPQGDS